MDDSQRESLEPTLPQMVERFRQQNQNAHELVKQVHREAAERERQQREQQRLLVEQSHRAAVEEGSVERSPPYRAPTVHYTELPAAPQNSQLYQEWNYYRREVGRLLAEGKEGQFVLINGEQIIGIWDTLEEAETVAFHKYPLVPSLIHQVQRCEPVVRGPSRFWRCPS